MLSFIDSLFILASYCQRQHDKRFRDVNVIVRIQKLT